MKSRARFCEKADGVSIRVPSRCNVFITLFMSVWLCGWAIGWGAAIVALVHRFVPFIFFWLCAWTLGGSFVLHKVLWSVFGFEELSRNPTELVYRKGLGPWSRSWEYDLKDVSNLRVLSPDTLPLSYGRFYNLARIGFDYGGKTIRFAFAVDEAEAAQIVAALKR